MPTVSAFWGVRPATRSEVAALVAKCLERLALIDPALSEWRARGWSDKSAAKNPLYVLEPARLAKRLSVNRTDVGREPIPELGFSMGGWNGGPEGETSGFDAHAGSYSKWVNNSFVINLPDSWAGGSEKVHLVAEALREVWDPDEVRLFEHRGDVKIRPGRVLKADPGRVLWSRKRRWFRRTGGGE